MGGLVHVEWRLAISNDGILYTQPLQELHLCKHVGIIIMPNKVTPLTSADYMHMLHQPLYMIPCVYLRLWSSLCDNTNGLLSNALDCLGKLCHL